MRLEEQIAVIRDGQQKLYNVEGAYKILREHLQDDPDEKIQQILKMMDAIPEALALIRKGLNGDDELSA